MALVPVGGPAVEPVSLAEAKAHLRVTSTSEDLLIASLITAARVHLEVMLSCAFITQSWSWFLDDWPKRYRLDGAETLRFTLPMAEPQSRLEQVNALLDLLAPAPVAQTPERPSASRTAHV